MTFLTWLLLIGLGWLNLVEGETRRILLQNVMNDHHNSSGHNDSHLCPVDIAALQQAAHAVAWHELAPNAHLQAGGTPRMQGLNLPQPMEDVAIDVRGPRRLQAHVPWPYPRRKLSKVPL